MHRRFGGLLLVVVVATSFPATLHAAPLPTYASVDTRTDFARSYFGARYYNAKGVRFTTVDPVYTWQENLVDPQRWNRYAYVRNNPLRYTDPDGRVIDTLADIGFIAYDLFDIGRSYVRGESVSGTQIGALGLDVIGAAIPVVTGGGAALRAAAKAERMRALERGVESEGRVLEALGEVKNTSKVKGCEGCSIPDFQNGRTVGEITDAKTVSNTRQLRIQKEAAQQSGREHQLITGEKTRVTDNAAQGTKVVRREDIGPK